MDYSGLWILLSITLFNSGLFVKTDFLSLLGSEIIDYCITNSSSAMFYTTHTGFMDEATKIVPRPPYFCDFERGNRRNTCLKDFAGNTGEWQIVNSLQYENLPLFDLRWEGLPVEQISQIRGRYRDNRLYFKQMLEIENANNFNITLSLRATEVHILFCDKNNVSEASCYWFILQGWGGNKTVLRKCMKQIPYFVGRNAASTCSDSVIEVSHPADYPTFLERKNWSHVTFEKQGNKLLLRNIKHNLSETILQYTENEKVFDIRYMFGHTKKGVASYKIHMHDYLRTTRISTTDVTTFSITHIGMKKICFSMMLTTCEDCWTDVIFYRKVFQNPEESIVIAESQISPSYGVWTEHKIKFRHRMDHLYDIKIGFRTKTRHSARSTKKFWSIDNYRLCNKEEYRVSKLRSRMKSCNLLFPSQNITWMDFNSFSPESRCQSLDRLEESYAPCDVLKQDNFVKTCQKLKVCELMSNNITCFCSPGYTGPNCDKEIFSSTLSYTQVSDETTPSGNDKNEKFTMRYDAYYALILLLFLVPFVIGVIIHRKRARRISISMDTNVYVNTRGPSLPEPSEGATMKNCFEAGIPTDTSATGSIYSEEVYVAHFENYVKISILTGDFERQFELLSSDLTEYSECYSPMITESDNTYLDLVAYDHARVKLNHLPGDEQCPYINASFIDGYKTPRAYIATQTPGAENFELYWRMVWQENVKYIFMLSSTDGKEKNKFGQFWPDEDKELSFLDISVINIQTTVSSDFESRTFKLMRNKEERKVEKILFRNWPQNDILFHPQNLIPFVLELLKVHLSSYSPVVVQCSNGLGQTGTILLIDINLRMVSDKGVVDILNNLQKLRNQKPNMVDNVELYKQTHLIVLHIMNDLRTSIPCCHMNEMSVTIIDEEEYKIQMDYLRRIEWQNQAMERTQIYTEIFVNYPEKNRIQHIYPGNRGRVFLEKYPKDDISSSYINAVQVDGYKCGGRYIVTQQPMPNTLADFWRLVVEKDINIIVSLNEVDIGDETCCAFMPTVDDSVFRPVDYILVTCTEVVTMQNYVIHHLLIENINKKEKIDVKVLEFKKWPARNILPLSCEEFFSFWEEVDTISKGSKQILVTCFDGATASGVFVALSFVIEKMKVEQKCDVCQAVQIVRHNRKEFVTEEKQYVFLFVLAIRFINGFQFYVDF